MSWGNRTPRRHDNSDRVAGSRTPRQYTNHTHTPLLTPRAGGETTAGAGAGYSIGEHRYSGGESHRYNGGGSEYPRVPSGDMRSDRMSPYYSRPRSSVPVRSSPSPAPAYCTQVADGMLKFTIGPHIAPCNVKLRKKLDIWPFHFTLGADYNISRKQWEGVFACKDKMIGGRVGVNLQRKQITYQKHIDIGGNSMLAFRAGSTLGEDHRWHHSMAVMLEPVQGAFKASMVRNSFDVRMKVPIAPALRAEVCGSLTMPLPAAEYSMNGDGLTFSLGQEGFHVHVAEVNALIRF